MIFHIDATNSEPLSDVQTDAKPNLDVQECNKASAQALVVASLIGMASKNLLDLQMTVRRNLYPLLGGSGPHTSTWICENRLCGTGNSPSCRALALFGFVDRHG